MFSRKSVRNAAVLLGGAALVAASLAGCTSGGSNSSAPNVSKKVAITFQTGNSSQNVGAAKQLIAAFEKKYPKITVKLDPVVQGTDGDNLIKTRLATGSADDVMYYNSGALLQALHPDSTLVDLSKQPWVKNLTPDFKQVVSTKKGLYGAPFGSSFAGGIMYNKKVYAKLGLSIPTTWKEFISNSEKIKAAGNITPILQSYGDTWTSQLFVLADYANIAAQDKGWAAAYTANKEKYATGIGLEGWNDMEQAFKAGLFNKDYASMTNAQALTALATGAGAQYPMLTTLIATTQQNNPSDVNDIGYFALPADNGKYTSASIWEPQALYIAKTAKGDALTASELFVTFANSPTGCKVQDAGYPPAGPYVDTSCKLPASAPPIAADVQKYITAGHASPALEFLSPIKGPNLEKIAIQVGSGISTAKQGAALYDQDVKAQAQQLGLPGWN